MSINEDEQLCIYSAAPQAARLVLIGVMLAQAIIFGAGVYLLVRI